MARKRHRGAFSSIASLAFSMRFAFSAVDQLHQAARSHSRQPSSPIAAAELAAQGRPQGTSRKPERAPASQLRIEMKSLAQRRQRPDSEAEAVR